MVLKVLSWSDTVRIKQTVAEDRHLTFWGDLTKTAVAIVCVANLAR